MSLAAQLKDHIDCIPDDHAVGGQPHHQKQSYRSSLSASPRPSTALCHTDNDPNRSNMDQFNDDMLPTTQKSAGNSGDVVVQAPALPPRSALRASRLLATMPQKLPTEDRPVLTPAAPHLLYLSSEEDASSSADDFSDCEYSSDSEQSQETPEGRTSHEDTARMVSVVFSGKPSIIELPRKSFSRSSSTDSAVGGLLRTSTEPTLVCRKDSASSTSLAALQRHPPRSSSMMSTSFDLQRPPPFLHVDPLAAPKAETEEPEAQQTRKPTMFKRTLSLVRKRSKPLLNPGSAHSRENLTIQTAPMEQVGEEKEENHVSESRSASARLPSTYQDLISSARRTSYSASSPISPVTSPSSPTKRIRSGFMARRRSSIRA